MINTAITTLNIGKQIIDIIPEPIKNKIVDNVGLRFNEYKAKALISEYLEQKYTSLSKMKTLLYKNPVALSEFYVQSPLKYEENFIKEEELINFIFEKSKVVISGLAGLGKSVLCKSIFLNIVNNNHGVLPIFIELKDLNNYKYSIIKYICESISSIDGDLKETTLERIIKHGNVILILDGFDELNFNIREKYTSEIIELTRKYRKIKIIVSGRPDISFRSWNEFSEISIENLDKDSAINLIKKLDFDTSIKEKFISKLDSEFYDLHTSFVSNPLLLTMMLLTFEEFAEIPNRIHLFYEHAFKTLYYRHDALKSSFKRDSRTKLDINDFSRIFSYFCLYTHIKKEHTFNENRILDLFEKSILHTKKPDIKSKDFLSDSMDHLCLIQRDGLDFTFTHRSFQEYFCAVYLSQSNSSKLYRLLDQVAMANENKIISILYDMNNNLVEKHWIVEKIKELLEFSSTTFEEKENKIKECIKIFLIRKSRKHLGNYFLTYSCKSTKDGYNYESFYKHLWEIYFTDISFSSNEIYLFKDSIIILNHKNIEEIFNRFNLFKSGDDYLFSIETLKDISEDIYINFVNFFYDELINKPKDILNKILRYITECQQKNIDDIDELIN